MSRFAFIVGLFLVASLTAGARHARHAEPAVVPGFQVGGLQFVIPATWQAEPSQSSARAAQWVIPPARVAGASSQGAPAASDGVKIVVFFFGAGVGGSVQENIDGWAGTITAPDGTPVKAAPRRRTVAGHLITEVLFSGTYAQDNPPPGLPPTLKPGYSLLGAVIENPAGNIYWRVTGPTDQVAALAPVVDQVLDSLKPQTGP